MRCLTFSLALFAGLLGLSRASHAQFSNGSFGSDPFNSYYGYYVPQQQAFAAQLSRGNVASINLNAADRRASALAQRTQNQSFGAYDPSLSDINNQFSNRRPLRPPTILLPGQPSSAVPYASYYTRTGNYYLGLRSGLPGSVGRPAPVGRRR